MAWLVRGLCLAAFAGGLGGCAIAPPMTDHPYPVYGNPVSPTPVRYRVICTSLPTASYLIDQNFGSTCYQVIVPDRYREVVISTRG